MTGRALVTPYRWTDCTWPRTGTRSVLCAEASSAQGTGQQPRTIAHAVHSLRMRHLTTTPNLQPPTPKRTFGNWTVGSWEFDVGLLLCGLRRLRCFGVHSRRHHRAAFHPIADRDCRAGCDRAVLLGCRIELERHVAALLPGLGNDERR